MLQFQGFKPAAMQRMAKSIGFEGDMQEFNKFLDDNPDKVRLFALRGFGESLYHSITDASLEFGFKSV